MTEQTGNEFRVLEDLLHSIIETAPIAIFWKDRSSRFMGCNRRFAQDAGLDHPSELIGKTDFEMRWRAEAETYRRDDQEIMASGTPKLDYEEPRVRPDGTITWISTSKVPMRGENGQAIGILGIYRDVTEEKHAENFLAGQESVLELVADGAPLRESLAALAQIIEDESPGVTATILLLDEDGIHIRHGAAPNMPAEFVEAVDGESIGPQAGSCGTAAYRKEAVFVEDIEVDPLWADYAPAALKHGLRACWSTPIFDEGGTVLGTFAMYLRQPGLPQPGHLRLIAVATHIAAIAISRSRADEALRRSEARYRNLFEHASDGIYVIGESGKYVDANKRGCELLGYAREELCEKSLAEVLAPEELPRLDPQTGLMTGASPHLAEWLHRRKDGATFPGEVTARQLGDNLYLAIVRDLSERRQADAALRESEEKLRLFMRYSPSAVAMFDTGMRYIALSNRWRQVYGLDDRDVYGVCHYDVFPEVPERWRVIHRKCLAGATARCDEDKFIRSDGAEEWIQWEITPWWKADGAIGGIILFSEIITERKRIEQEIRIGEKRFRATFEQAAVGIAHVDTDGQWLRVNQKLCDILGYTRDELLTLGFNDLLHPDDLEQDLIDRRSLINTEIASYEAEKRYFRKTGETVWTDLTVTLVRTDAGDPDYFISVIEDISARKQAEEALVESEARLNEAQSSARIGSWRFIPPDTFSWSNQMYELFGLPHHRPVDHESILSTIHPDDQLAKYYEPLRTALETDAAEFKAEYRVISPEGAVRTMASLGKIYRDRYGNVKHVAGTTQDISERKIAEQALRNSEHKFSTLFRRASLPAALSRLPGHELVDVNDAWEQLFGYTKAEVVGNTLLQLGVYRHSSDVHETYVVRALEQTLYSKKGKALTILTNANVIQIDGHDFAITSMQDVTEQRNAERRIELLARYDQLTGLPNRRLLADRFKEAEHALPEGHSMALMAVDIDNFKAINDVLGRDIGDRVLVEMAKRIRTSLEYDDIVCRQSGDEFIVLLPSMDAPGSVRCATDLMEAIAQPFQVDSHELVSTVSIGITLYPHDGEELESLARNAAAAMNRAKQENRSSFCFYAPEMQEESMRALQLTNALRYALQREEFEIHYQPQVAIHDIRVVGVEALLRWQHPELGMISPAEFIPIAESSGLIVPIGEWVLRTATRQLKEWIGRGLPRFVMAVNLSSVQFQQAGLVDVVTNVLHDAQLPHDLLELELTEAVAMDDPESAIEIMDKLHNLGVRMSIDDFGTGYSSLSYLKKFRVSKLKVDQTFVNDITNDVEDRAIVSAIIGMARSLGILTIAEGVETADQLSYLQMQGCNEVQGYYFCKPVPPDECESFIRNFPG